MNEDAIYRAAPSWAQTILLNAHGLRISRHRFGRPLRRALAELEERQYWDPARMLEWQSARLRRLVQIAHQRSPYWRELFGRCGLKPGDVGHVEDLRKLPLLQKEDVRSRLSDILTAPPPKPGWLHGHTSGTTGSPLDLWYDRETAVLTNAADYRQKRWGGMRPGQDWIGMLLGRMVVPPSRRRGPFWRTNFVHRQVWFSSFHLSDVNLVSYVAEIRRRRLKFLEGYPSTLYILARFLERRGEHLPMTAVFSSSETLHSTQRHTIEAVFGCRLFDFYGLAERVIFAGECGSGMGKHIAEEYGLVEVVDGAGNLVAPGSPGYLVGTSLHNTAMPLFRYRTSDISLIRPVQCPCGRTGRLLEDIKTKAEDVVVTPDGRVLSPSILTHPFKPFHQILKSQLVQEALDRLHVRVVPSLEFTTDHQAELLAALRERLGPEMQISLSRESDIPNEPSGKFRWVVSNVRHDVALDWSRL